MVSAANIAHALGDAHREGQAADRIEALEEKLGQEFLGKAGWRKVADRLHERVWVLETALREIADWHKRGASWRQLGRNG